MPTVTISGTDYDVYADVATADEFLAADFSATLWRAETDEDQKARALVTATRLLDRMEWLGNKTDVDQPLEWPRSATGLDDVDPDVVPQAIIDGSVVLAKLIHSGSKVDSSASTSSNIRRQKAGSVEIEYFFPLEDGTRLPTEVMELVSRYLAGGLGLGGAIASGTCGKSITCSDFRPGINF
jgi:hypothetical protein